MKNKITNNIEYSGKVKISAIRDGIVLSSNEFHNSGTSTLFSFFSYCLMGAFEEASLFCPSKVRLLIANETAEAAGADAEVTAASGLVYVHTRPERVIHPEIDGGTVKFSFMIPRTMIDSVGFNRIALYPQYARDSDLYDYVAYCDLSGEDDLAASMYTAWSLSSVLLIDWELTISNKITKIKAKDMEVVDNG